VTIFIYSKRQRRSYYIRRDL